MAAAILKKDAKGVEVGLVRAKGEAAQPRRECVRGLHQERRAAPEPRRPCKPQAEAEAAAPPPLIQ
jgi:hypothetical protein